MTISALDNELSLDQLDQISGGKKSTDTLDPLGTSEESGSGDIVIYRDRNGDIEGTSETHYRRGPWR